MLSRQKTLAVAVGALLILGTSTAIALVSQETSRQDAITALDEAQRQLDIVESYLNLPPETTTLTPTPTPTPTETTTLPTTTTVPPPLPQPRIAYSADGNQHDDDDWASSAMLFAIMAHEALQANLVHFDYNSHVWDSNVNGPTRMRDSVNGAVQRWGFDPNNVFDDLIQLPQSNANLTEEINKSTPENPLLLSIAGPTETIWQAMNAANPAARANVKCISHGDWNETHASSHGGHTYTQVIALGCQRVEITDQNSRMGPTNISFWDFLRTNPNQNFNWLYTRFQLATQSIGDISDVGMVWYSLTNNPTGTRQNVKDLLLSPPK
jgi:hypothetical protein